MRRWHHRRGWSVRISSRRRAFARLWTFRPEGVAPAIRTGSAVLWEWVARCVRIDGVHLDACPSSDALDVVEVKVGVLSLEQCNAEGELAFYMFGVSAGDEGLAVSVFLVALYACRCARCAAGMF